MSKLLTVTQYANQNKVSVQSVYQRIKRGTLTSTIIDGIQYIDLTTKQSLDNDTNLTQVNILNELNVYHEQIINGFKREIKLLKKQLKKCEKKKNIEYDRLNKLFNLLYLPEDTSNNIIDVKVKKRKKNKK